MVEEEGAMTENPSADPMIGPSPGGALCWLLEVVLALISTSSPISAVAYCLLGHPMIGFFIAAYFGSKEPIFWLLTLVNVARLRKGECWPVWRKVYCCRKGGAGWYVLVREG